MTSVSNPRTLDRNLGEASRSSHASLSDVKDDVRRLKDDVSEYASDAAQTGIEAVKSGATHMAETGKHVAERAKETHEKVCHYVSANPTTSILIAAGIGALLARMLPRH